MHLSKRGVGHRITVDEFNSLIDSHNFAAAQMNGAGREDIFNIGDERRSGTVLCQNNSGGDFEPGDAIGLVQLALESASDIGTAEIRDDVIANEIMLYGTTPNRSDHSWTRLAICRDGIPNGESGQVIVSGLALAKVTISDDTHKCCGIIDDSGELKSKGAGGFQIIQAEAGTGIKWCLIRFAEQSVVAGVAKTVSSISGTGGGLTPGSASDVKELTLDASNNLVETGQTLTVFNTFDGDVAGDVVIHYKQDHLSGRLLVDAEECVPVVGYGGMYQATSAATGPNWPLVGFVVVDQYDTSAAYNTGLTTNPANGQFTLDESGLWGVSWMGATEIVEANQSRTVTIRLWNVTAGAEIGRFQQGVGRNLSIVNPSFQTQLLIGDFGGTEDASVGDALRVEIGEAGAAGDIVVVDWDTCAVNLSLIQAG